MKIKLTTFFLAILAISLSYSYEISSMKVPTSTFIPIYVSVTGDVKTPGVYTLSTVYRLSDAIYFADQTLTAEQISQEKTTPSSISQQTLNPKLFLKPDTTKAEIFGKRNITLIRQGQKQTYDLLKFYRLGDLDQNPFLKDGDVIIVNPVYQVVSVSGAVNKPGDYEYKQNDTIKDILDLTLGIKDNAELRSVKLYRYKENQIDFDILDLDISSYPTSSPTLSKQLQAGDRLIIPVNSEYRKALKVVAEGKVKSPGTYYVSSNTTLYDLLVLCGGPTSEGDLSNAYIFNRLKSDEADMDFQRLRYMPFANMTFMEYNYMRTKTRQLKGKYAVDIQKVWESQGKDENLILHDGDELFVPDNINYVWLTGQVKKPGLIQWQEGKSWKEYIQLAGGFANNYEPEGIRIIKASTGNWIKARKNVKIKPGDIIFIPEKEDKYFFDHFKDYLLVTTQLLTILLTMHTLGAF